MPPETTGSVPPSLLAVYISFARVGAVMFGGGYAMLPLLEREIIDRRHWCREEEMGELYALAQAAPGVIAVNTALVVGYRQRGAAGAAVAALGAITIPTIVVLIVFSQIDRIAGNPILEKIYAGLRPAVAGLLLSTSVRMVKREWTTAWPLCVGLAIMAMALFLKVNPAWFILGGAFFGGASYFVLKRLGRLPAGEESKGKVDEAAGAKDDAGKEGRK